jgi:hypothetical protein
MVCVVGIEPTTPTVSRWCSPTELHAQSALAGSTEYSRGLRRRQTIILGAVAHLRGSAA